MRFRVKLAVKIVAAALLLLVVGGFVYERVGERHDHKRFPQLGLSVDIGGRALNIYCSGEDGPTVVLERDIGAPGYSWLLIQREIAKFTRARWYDRSSLLT